MKPDYHLCDICGNKVDLQCRIFVSTGTHYDGVETDTTGDNLDLCGKCSLSIIDNLFLHKGASPDYENGVKLLAFVNKARKK